MNLLRVGTRLTLDVATPVELAAAPLLHGNRLRVVATAAAKQTAAVQSLAGSVALPPGRAPRDQIPIVHLVGRAVVWRFVHVDQVFRGREAEFGIPDLQLAALVDLHLCRAVILVPQIVSNLCASSVCERNEMNH